jgi:hypothetical protein
MSRQPLRLRGPWRSTGTQACRADQGAVGIGQLDTTQWVEAFACEKHPGKATQFVLARVVETLGQRTTSQRDAPGLVSKRGRRDIGA